MFVDVPGGGQLHVEVREAAKPPLLLLHGFTGGIGAWPARVLDGLADVRHLLVADLPGHGKSDTSVDPERYEAEHVVDDLIAVLDAAGVGRADWVGYSMGGRLALAAAVRHPSRVNRLVLESASPGMARTEDRSLRRQEDDELAYRVEKDFEGFVDRWMAMPLFQGQQKLGDLWLTRERRRRLRQHPASLAACLRGLGAGSQPPLWDALPQLDTPTLVLVGALDGKFVDIGERMAEQIPRAQYALIEDAGHTVHAEATDAWLATVVDFLIQPEEAA